MRWKVYEPDGETPALVDVLDRHGDVARRQHESAWQPNLITDVGLDDLVESTYWSSWRSRLVVGTGSSEPAFTDSALDTEVEEGTTNGDNAETSRTVGSTIITRLNRVSKRVTLTANRNLTEYGFRRLSAGSLNIRELFRDELGDPVTISMLSGKILQVDHELTADLPRDGILDTLTIEERDATNTLISTTPYDVEIGFVSYTGYGTSGTTLEPFIVADDGEDYYLKGRTVDFSLPTTVERPGSTTNGPYTFNQSLYTFSTYVAGTRYRDITIDDIPVSSLNGIFHGFDWLNAKISTYQFGDGVTIQLLDPTTFEKLSTHTLSLGFRHSWDRAAGGSGS
jgi:hypothetical protein